jgi:hypothetical protein
MIDKLLLSHVLSVNVSYLSDKLDGDFLPYETTEGWQKINIYELAFKVKIWAMNNGHQIDSSSSLFTFSGIDYLGFSGVDYFCDDNSCGEYKFEVHSKTEVDSIFDAGFWVLKNKLKLL